MKIFFLLNPSRSKNRWDERETSAQAAKRFGWTPRFGEVDRAQPRSTDRLIEQALEEGCERLVVVGGDGTLHRAVNALGRLNALRSELAVVPAGTCNDFARWLGIRSKEKALQLACTGKARLTDLGQMDGTLFLNNAGLGRQQAAGGKVSTWKTLKRFRPIPLRAEWDKGSIEGAFYMAMTCNAPYFSGGLHFSKTVSVQDGLLDAYLVPVMPKWRLLSVLAWARLGRPGKFRQLAALRVKHLEIRSKTDIWPQADGEPPARAVRRVVFAVSPEKAMIVSP